MVNKNKENKEIIGRAREHWIKWSYYYQIYFILFSIVGW